MENGKATGTAGHEGDGERAPLVQLEVRQERGLIRPPGSRRHVDFGITVGQVTIDNSRRMPLTLALVLDRSGSMHREKLEMAKRATHAILERLDERDQVAVVVFDDRIDVLQEAAVVTPTLRERVRRQLQGVEARRNTALHEGWLTGCRAIAADTLRDQERGLSYCFLLTDGLANVGETDPERIATDAAGIREQAGISTSTFGIGPDYDERLLGPMAQAGAGQFHNLRTPQDTANAFTGQLGELLAVAAAQVSLELLLDPGVTADVISMYWAKQKSDAPGHWVIDVGALLGGEERHIAVRFGFPARNERRTMTLRARLCWSVRGEKQASDWQELQFTYADHDACNAERRDPRVMHWAGLHHAERARRDAVTRSGAGDLAGAREILQKTVRHIERYAGDDVDLLRALHDLRQLEREVGYKRADALMAKEVHYVAYRASRGQRDLRDPQGQS